MPFSPSDLDDLLLHGGDAHPSGRNRLSAWDVLPAGSSASDQATLVSLHESLHATLTGTSAYGSLLHVYGHLAGRLPEEPAFLRVFRTLLVRCRTTHESYATYVGLMILRQGQPDTSVLQPYPSYLRYYGIGESLARGFSGGYLRHAAAMAALRLCMQGVAVETVLVRGLRAFRPADLRYRDYPDQRLNALLEAVSPTFWQTTYDQARRARPNLSAWEVYQASEADNRNFDAAVAEEFDEASLYLLQSFHDALAGLLNARGMASLAWDGQREFSARLIDAANAVALPGPNASGLRAATPHETADSFVAVQFALERLVVNPVPPEGRVRRLGDVPENERHQLVSSTGADAHVFLVVRPARLLAEQATLSPDDRAFMDGLGDTPVVAIRSSRPLDHDGRQSIEHVLLESPEELTAFAEAMGGIAPLVGCYFLSSHRDAKWGQRWFDALSSACNLVYLMDVSPFLLLPYWFSEERARVRYAAIHFSIEDVQHDILAFRSETELRKVLLLPGSSVMCRAVTYYCREQFPRPEVFLEDETFLQEHLRELTIVLSHVFAEESFFAFLGTTQRGER